MLTYIGFCFMPPRTLTEPQTRVFILKLALSGLFLILWFLALGAIPTMSADSWRGYLTYTLAHLTNINVPSCWVLGRVTYA